MLSFESIAQKESGNNNQETKSSTLKLDEATSGEPSSTEMENKENASASPGLFSFVFACLHNVLYLSLVVRKPVFGVSDQVRQKPGCPITEYS